jgi:2-amino-4-hydroxy-6-hydroxymethyldihydropteridine diphosphokinase
VGGSANQPSFFNAAVLVETDLDPAALKQTLLSIERRLGRIRTEDKYAPRPIDLDIALYSQQVYELNGRHIPDPDLARFPHVLLPLVDVAPGWIHPELGVTLQEIMADLEFSEKEIQKL